MNVIKNAVIGLTALTILASANMAMAAPATNDAQAGTQKRMVALSDAQKQERAQKHLERRYADLDLSKAQLAKIQAIETQYRAQVLPQTRDLKEQALINRMAQLKQERLAVLQTKNWDEVKAQKWLSQQGEVSQQYQQERQRTMAAKHLNDLKKEHAIFQVLNKKQQQAYLERANKAQPMHSAQRLGKPAHKPHPHHGHHGAKGAHGKHHGAAK